MNKNENINPIVDAVMKNSELKQAVQDLNAAAKASSMSKADYAGKLQALLADAGIEAAAEDIQYYVSRGGRLELSEDDLDNVSGGCSSDGPTVTCPRCGSTNARNEGEDFLTYVHCYDCGYPE